MVSAAHRVGLRTTSTLMFGSVEEGPSTWAAHLVALRELQQRAESRQLQQQGGEGRSSSGSSSSRGVGLTEFVPLPFVHMEAPVYLQVGVLSWCVLMAGGVLACWHAVRAYGGAGAPAGGGAGAGCVNGMSVRRVQARVLHAMRGIPAKRACGVMWSDGVMHASTSLHMDVRDRTRRWLCEGPQVRQHPHPPGTCTPVNGSPPPPPMASPYVPRAAPAVAPRCTRACCSTPWPAWRYTRTSPTSRCVHVY